LKESSVPDHSAHPALPSNPPVSTSGAAPRLRSEFADDPDMAEIVSMFVSEMPQKIQKLSESFELTKFDELRRLAHQLKGSSGGYGFPTLGLAAGKLERTLNSHADGAGTGDPVLAIRSQVDEVLGLCKRVII